MHYLSLLSPFNLLKGDESHQNIDILQSLPKSILYNVFDFLTFNDLHRISLTSNKYKAIVVTYGINRSSLNLNRLMRETYIYNDCQMMFLAKVELILFKFRLITDQIKHSCDQKVIDSSPRKSRNKFEIYRQHEDVIYVDESLVLLFMKWIDQEK